MPPTRFRVIERDRRLVVVDRGAGNALAAAVPASRPSMAGTAQPGAEETYPPKAATRLPRQVRFDGGAILRTHASYDDRGPRTLQLSGEAMRWLGLLRAGGIALLVAWVITAVFFPILFFAPLLLFTRGVRELLRAQATAWLDRWGDEAPKTA